MATNILYYYDNATPDSGAIAGRVEQMVTSLAQMQAVNADGGLRLWVAPRYNNRRHFAWNPITFKAYQFVFNIGDYATIPSGAVQYNVTIASTSYKIWNIKTLPTEVSLSVYDSSVSKEIVLKADTMQGVAVFNVAPVVRNWFSDRVSDPSGNSTFIVDDTTQYTHFKVNIEQGVMRMYNVQNAVSQAGEDGDKSFPAFVKLTDDYKLIRWDYIDSEQHYSWHIPRCPICSIYLRNGKSMTYNGQSVSLNGGSVYRFYVATASQCAELNGAFSGLNLEWENKVYYNDVTGETCHPYPIRWVNRKGGIDQYVFLHRQFKTKESRTTGLRDVYSDNTGTQITNRKPYAVEGSRTIKVGAERISAEELDLLTKLPYSPQIEWYDLAQNDGNGIWTGVSVDKFSNTEQTDAACHDFEIELECPAINMQFE